MARTHEHERYVGTRARAALVARIDEVAEDAVPSTTVDGVPVITAFSRATGSGYAVAVIDYGPDFDLLWVVGMDDGGEIWCVPNPQVRLQANWSMGRSKKQPRVERKIVPVAG